MFNDPTTSTLRVRLCLDVDYALNGEAADDMLMRLHRMCELAIGEGLLTGESAAEVDSHEISVVVLPETVSEEALADHMVQRIDDGTLTVEDIPLRLVRYGLMEPHAFVAEMRERLGLDDAERAAGRPARDAAGPGGDADEK